MHRLDGRVALVTGGARGIGAAIAEALIDAGAAVMITDLSEDGAQTATRIGASFIHHDVTDEAQWEAAVAATTQRLGGLDILVNNAGIYLGKPLLQTSLAEFQRVQAVNVDGVFLGMKTALPAMAARAYQWPGGASIINLSSVAGLVGTAGTLAYNASKGAVRLMTKSAALECAAGGLKIRVNSVHPAVIDTAMGTALIDNFADMRGEGNNMVRQQVTAAHPLGRLGTPQEVAAAVAFLAGDGAGFMTGSEVVIDGGLTAQ